MELGSIAELVSAFGTIAALVAASVAVRATIKTNNQQGVQLRYLEDAESRRRVEADQQDAARIAVWMGIDDDGQPVARLANDSGLPTYELSVWVAISTDMLRISYQVHGPTNGARILRRVRNELLGYSERDSPIDWAELLATGQLSCAATFRDASNRWWLRDFDGTLVRKPDRDVAESAVRTNYQGLFKNAP